MAFEYEPSRLPGIFEGPLAGGNVDALKSALQGEGKIAFVLGGSATNEDAAALKTLVEKLGDRAEVFVGTFAPVKEPDGISKSGDPVANRAGFALFGFIRTAEELLNCASEFETLVTLSADLWGSDAAKAQKLEAIPNRVSISSKNDLTAQKSSTVFGVNHWSEVNGTMVNSARFSRSSLPLRRLPKKLSFRFTPFCSLWRAKRSGARRRLTKRLLNLYLCFPSSLLTPSIARANCSMELPYDGNYRFENVD